eukprot:3287767-Prymnesium_polylepis.2
MTQFAGKNRKPRPSRHPCGAPPSEAGRGGRGLGRPPARFWIVPCGCVNAQLRTARAPDSAARLPRLSPPVCNDTPGGLILRPSAVAFK